MADLVDVSQINSNILLDLRYATRNNFLGKKIYSKAKCFLRKRVAGKLSSVQKELEKMDLGLKIFDGYRPLSVQKLLWKIMPDERYVANPAIGSSHNRGCAVDVTLVDKKGKELTMPTDFDDFTKRAHRTYFNLPKKVSKNRQLLEDLMTSFGFLPFPSEWWHFDDVDWEKYEILDIPFEKL